MNGPIQKSFYLGWIFGGPCAGLICFLLALVIVFTVPFDPQTGYHSLSAAVVVGLSVVGLCLHLVGMVLLFVLYYKMWAVIQDGYARTTPAMAVGLMFIPLFNLYWSFQALWGFAKDYNNYLLRHNINAKPLSEKLYLTACICPLLGILPFVGIAASLVMCIVYTLIIVNICDAINAIFYTQSRQGLI